MGIASIFPLSLVDRTAALLEACRQRAVTLACAESCTGGLLSALLTEIPGASAVFTGGWVAYANSQKINTLGVPAPLIDRYGAVSSEVAVRMAAAARALANTSYALALTGIAGPDGGSADKPVGTVFIALATPDGQTPVHHFSGHGTRLCIRLQAVEEALRLFEEVVKNYE